MGFVGDEAAAVYSSWPQPLSARPAYSGRTKLAGAAALTEATLQWEWLLAREVAYADRFAGNKEIIIGQGRTCESIAGW